MIYATFVSTVLWLNELLEVLTGTVVAYCIDIFGRMSGNISTLDARQQQMQQQQMLIK